MFGLAFRVVTWDPRALSPNPIDHQANPRGLTQPVIPSKLAKMNISTLAIGHRISGTVMPQPVMQPTAKRQHIPQTFDNTHSFH